MRHNNPFGHLKLISPGKISNPFGHIKPINFSPIEHMFNKALPVADHGIKKRAIHLRQAFVKRVKH